MTESEMKSAVQSFRTVEYEALKGKMEFMLDTHASDHVTATHVNLGVDRPKSWLSFLHQRSGSTSQRGVGMLPNSSFESRRSASAGEL